MLRSSNCRSIFPDLGGVPFQRNQRPRRRLVGAVHGNQQASPVSKEPSHEQNSRNNAHRRVDAVLWRHCPCGRRRIPEVARRQLVRKARSRLRPISRRSMSVANSLRIRPRVPWPLMAVAPGWSWFARHRRHYQDRRQLLQGHLYRLEHGSCRPQRQALGQCAHHPGIRWAKDVNGDRPPNCRSGKGRRQWHAADHGRTDPATGKNVDHQRDQPAPLVSQAAAAGPCT